MVKLVPVGKQRPFSRGLLLTFLTFGLYGVYWLYKAPHEVYEQFELDEERRDEGIMWLVVGLVVPLLVFVYMWRIAENVRYVRRRLRLDDGVAPATFVGLHVAGPLVALVLAAVLFAAPGGDGATSEEDATLLTRLTLGVVAASFALVAFGYFRLQTSINEVWEAWAVRAERFRAPRPVPPPPA